MSRKNPINVRVMSETCFRGAAGKTAELSVVIL